MWRIDRRRDRREVGVGTRISIIGAGSAVFSLRLIRDLCLAPGLRRSSVSLMDIDRGRLDGVHALCRRYADEVGAELDLSATTDRRASLDGADFVVVTALAAGHDRLRAGWEVAAAHGYRFGGSLHVMHDEAFWVNFSQYRLFGSVIEDVLSLCPDAWVQLVANPVLAGITSLPQRYPGLKIVGLCHGFHGVYRLADLLGIDHEGLTFEIPGVNHHVWLTHCYHRGRDVFPLIDEWIETKSADYWQTCPLSDLHGPKPFDLYRRFGVFPIGDTANPGGGAWGWWYHVDEATERHWKEDPAGWYARHFARGEERLAEIKRLADDRSRRVTDVFPPTPSGEVMVPIIESIACDIPRTIVVNIPNDGDYVPGIPGDFAVEIPALVSKRGIQGIRTHGLPTPVIAQILRDRVAPVTLELEAYEQGSKELLLQLLMTDPWTRSEEQASAMLDAILALPINAEMRAHYR
jgi:alpha-galactosidase